MSKKQGAAIKEARTNAGLTQAALAEQLQGVSASDISKAERGEKELSQEVIKQIARITGVTQTSLLNPTGSSSSGKSSTGKPTSGKTTTGKSSSKKTSSGKTTASKTSSASGQTSMKVTASEKKLVELYRKADADTKKAAVKLLKGEQEGLQEILNSVIGNAVNLFIKK